jgi:hypothetical protein
METGTSHERDIVTLLDDIAYVNKASGEEIERVGRRIDQLIAGAALPREIADALAREISGQLGPLSAQVKFTASAVRSLQSQSGQSRSGQSRSAPASPAKSDAPAGLCFPAEALAGNKNLLPLEAANGLKFSWSGADPEIRFEFALDRSQRVELQMRLVALIKPEYSRQMRVLVDGRHLAHRFAPDGALYLVSCVLPATGQAGQTEVRIILPDTHCPTDLGSGLDGRRLGIAIHEIRFVRPRSALGRLFKWLKLAK